METEKTNSNKVDIHINNGGISMSIDMLEYDTLTSNLSIRKPVLNISAQHFGHQTNQMKILFTPDRLQQLGVWFIEEAQKCKEWYNDPNAESDSFGGVHSKFQIKSQNEEVEEDIDIVECSHDEDTECNICEKEK